MGTPRKKLEDLISEEELNQIIEMYQNNISLRKIEEKTHHARHAIAKMLERLNIKKTKGNHYKYNFFDFNFFEKIDNELSAYWLGFLYADGCIITPTNGEQCIKLDLAERDIDAIQKFKEDLKSTYPIRWYQPLNKNAQRQARQELRSQKTVDDLKKLECVERKSLIIKFPTKQQVPEEFVQHFIRGYFDGDGSISNYNNAYQVSFVGTEDFIKSLYDYFKMGSVLKDKRKENSWYLNIGGNFQVIKVYHMMYDNSTRYLDRKYNKFQELLIKYGESQG